MNTHGGRRAGSGRKLKLNNYVTVMFRIPAESKDKLKIYAVAQRKSMGDIINDLINKFL